MWKFKEQNEIFQDIGAKMTGELALELTKNNEEWSERNVSAQKEEKFFDILWGSISKW